MGGELLECGLRKCKKMVNELRILEEIKSIAQNGLYYAKDEFDKKRYERLLKICCQEYADSLKIDIEATNFLKELGQITPKIGINAAIIKEGKLFIAKRKDDLCWEVPGGWAEVGEAPRQSIEREVIEETNLRVKALEVIEVFARLSGEQLFTSYHILFRCELIGGEFKPSNETSEVKWIKKEEIENIQWHKDHFELAKKAFG